MPQIEVTFDIDANGIVNVSAKDKATAKEQQIRIQASGGPLRQRDRPYGARCGIPRGRGRAAPRAGGTRNHAEALIHSTEKTLAEHGDKIDAANKGEIEAQIADLREALGGEDPEAIKGKMELLGQSAMKLGEAMYAAGQAGDAGAGPMDEPQAGPAPTQAPEAASGTRLSTPTSRRSTTRRTGRPPEPGPGGSHGTGVCRRPGAHAQRLCGALSHGQGRLLRPSRRVPRCQRGRPQEVLSQARDAIPSGPQSG